MTDGDRTSKTPSAPEVVSEMAAAMHAGRQVSPDRLRALMRIPGDLDFPTLARVVEYCLASAFSITMPRAARAQIKLGVETAFEAPAGPGLPPRRVRVAPTADPPVCEVTGAAPEPGRDSRAVVKFDWRKRSGRIKPDGSIDWKDINSVPNVNQGALLAEIHDRTTGRPGMDVYGRAIRPEPGRRHPVRWMKGSIVAQRDDDAGMYRLLAACSGVVLFTFRVPGNPETLESLEIAERLTINGDIDYDYGDLTSAASLEIKGSIRGTFSLKSGGHVRVTGAIEGRDVEAERISAGLITNGCRVTARDTVEAGSLANCVITAGEVRVTTSVSSASIRTRGRVLLGRDCAVMAARIQAAAVVMEQVVVSGRVEIRLGEDIFTRAEATAARLREHEAALAGQAEAAREAARDVIAHCPPLEKAVRRFRPGTVPARLFARLREMLAEAFANTRAINDLAVSLAYELQDVLGDHGLSRGVLRAVDLVIARMKKYNNLYLALAELRTLGKEARQEIEDLRKEARDLRVEANRVTPMNASAELRIRCGNATLLLEGDDLPPGPFMVTYHLPDDADDLRHGELRISSRQDS